jgi:bile acid:Na+ symporter, BASS family
MKSLVPLLIQLSLMLVVASVGMQARWRDLTGVFNQPRLLFRGIVAVHVVVPAVALLMVLLLPMAPIVKVGIFIMAASPLAPFVPGKMIKTGADTSYAIGLCVALMSLAVIIVPATLGLVSWYFQRELSAPVGPIAMLIFTSVLLPLVAGLFIGTFFPHWSRWFAPAARIFSIVVLLPVIVLFLYSAGSQIIAVIGNGTLLATFVAVAAGLAAGHWLGGPEPANRVALALATATRHPGIAALIVHANYQDKRAMMAVVLFLLNSVIVSALYKGLMARRHHPVSAPSVPRDPSPVN